MALSDFPIWSTQRLWQIVWQSPDNLEMALDSATVIRLFIFLLQMNAYINNFNLPIQIFPKSGQNKKFQIVYRVNC